ncbi:hypothetical protein GCM10009557_12350 [Virgisporangium ochraceum]|uniref:Uncharacterized protein n=1 Tax=Virgisporangium ochraceum TaxID=65505 RepID=A0A8J4A8Q9_9ACTN|nr:hypothetical protein [Virgisporangium ochraceum]GIJ75425.1 hypothetical protein Voc01_103420 [Virgisporangium ochraceum]
MTPPSTDQPTTQAAGDGALAVGPSDIRPDLDPDGAGYPGGGARAGDIQGLLIFLRWVESTAEQWGLARGSVEDVRSAWRAVCGRLDVPDDSPVVDVDIDVLAERCRQDGMRLSSVGSYQARMRTGRGWYLEWLAGRPDWRRRRASRRYSRLAAPQPASEPARRTIDIPVRPDAVVTVSMPADLRPAEADIVHALLLNMIRSGAGD